MSSPLFDTHTHFDVADFDQDRTLLAQKAKKNGVERLVLIGFLASRFSDLARTQCLLAELSDVPTTYLAPGLHPFYIEQHFLEHLVVLEKFLIDHSCVAIGEIGLDTYLKHHKQIHFYQKQKYYFMEQLDLAVRHNKPVILHIRKSHSEVLQLLKQHRFKLGGIAHAFSGGIEEAKAFIKLGFKLGVTGQITNPNAKKLHQVVQSVGIEHLVIETDCPDMTPLCCQRSTSYKTRNEPSNLIYVLQGLAQSLNLDQEIVAEKLWNNSLQALHLI